jgi:hypothetical protein
MTRRRRIALAAALVTGLGLAVGPAAAHAALPSASNEGDAAAVDSIELFEQPMDARGRPTGPRVRVDPAQHQPDARAVARAAGPRPSTQRPASSRRTLQAASGCKTVWVARTRTSVFGSLLWRYQQDKYFCWSYPQVTTVSVSAYPCCLDPFWRWAGNIGSSGWYFSKLGSSRGGHYSFRQGKFEQTVLGQVTATATPWTKLWVHGDGSWSYATDVSS